MTAVIDPAAVSRGRERLAEALRGDNPLDQRERLALTAVLVLLDAAAELTDEAPGEQYPHLAGVLTGVVDGYRAQLARLGAR